MLAAGVLRGRRRDPPQIAAPAADSRGSLVAGAMVFATADWPTFPQVAALFILSG
jgi:hypothetical protein